MKAISCCKYYEDIEVEIADKYIKRVFESAEYYFNDSVNNAVGAFIPRDDLAEEIGYIIGNKKHELSYTSNYKTLVKQYVGKQHVEETNKVVEQMRLF